MQRTTHNWTLLQINSARLARNDFSSARSCYWHWLGVIAMPRDLAYRNQLRDDVAHFWENLEKRVRNYDFSHSIYKLLIIWWYLKIGRESRGATDTLPVASPQQNLVPGKHASVVCVVDIFTERWLGYRTNGDPFNPNNLPRRTTAENWDGTKTPHLIITNISMVVPH